MMSNVLITGASSGIGKAFAELFARKGCRVILASRNAEKGSELAEQLERNLHSCRLGARQRP